MTNKETKKLQATHLQVPYRQAWASATGHLHLPFAGISAAFLCSWADDSSLSHSREPILATQPESTRVSGLAHFRLEGVTELRHYGAGRGLLRTCLEPPVLATLILWLETEPLDSDLPHHKSYPVRTGL